MSKVTVNVDLKIKSKVKKHVSKTKQTVGGFYDLAAKEKLERENNTMTNYIIPGDNASENFFIGKK